MDLLRLFIIAVIPGIALALGLYLTDRYDREPVKLLVKLFLFGILSAVPTIFVERFLSNINIFPGIFSVSGQHCGGFNRRIFQRLAVMRIAYHHHAFNEKLDGIIYCAFHPLVLQLLRI